MQKTMQSEPLKISFQKRRPTQKKSSSSVVGTVFDAPINTKSDISMNDSSTNRNRGSIASNQQSDDSLNIITDNGIRSHQVLEWDDPLEERPITFRIRDSQNNNDCTHYTIEVQTTIDGPSGYWSVKRRYSEFRELYNNLKRLANQGDPITYKGLLCMFEKVNPQDPPQTQSHSQPSSQQIMQTQPMNASFSGDSTKQSVQTTNGNCNSKGAQNLFSSFTHHTQNLKPSQTLSSQHNCIVFPGRKLFKMKKNVINQRMKELAQFLNDLLDTRKCVFSSVISFNILECEDFLKFIDCDQQIPTYQFVHDEQQKRINTVIRQVNEAHQAMQSQEEFSPKCAPGRSSYSDQSFPRNHSKNRGSFATNKSRSSSQIDLSKQTGDFRSTVLPDFQVDSQKQNLLSGRNELNLSWSQINQIPPNANEVRSLYTKKSAEKNCMTFLENLNSNDVYNKNEHMRQFYQLYQKQSFRMKTDLRLKLFMGTRLVSKKSAVQFDAFFEEPEMHSEKPLDGIIQLIGSFQDDPLNGMMQSDNLLKFLSDILNYNHSPQADVFNILFNNLDIYWIFKMNLPNFLRQNSPYKQYAQKLLHQYLVKKPIESMDHIALFFSDDASYQNINPSYLESYEGFMRYHKRQIKAKELGSGRSSGLRASEIISLRPQKFMSEEDLLDQSIISSRSRQLTQSMIMNKRRSSCQPNTRQNNNETMKTQPRMTSNATSSKKDLIMEDIHLNIDAYTKQWMSDLKDQNKQFNLSRKELIQIDRFKGQINLQKKQLYDVLVSDKLIQKVLRSDYSPKDSTYNVGLVQMSSLEPLEVFDQRFLTSLFNEDFDINQDFNQSFVAPQPGQEASLLTKISLDKDTILEVLIHQKTFESDTDGLFTIVVISEIDILLKKTTGKYAIIKLSSDSTKGFIDESIQDSIIIPLKPKKLDQNWIPLDIIEEAKSSESPSKDSTLTKSQNLEVEDVSMNRSTFIPPMRQAPSTKISMIVDWVSESSLSEIVKQNQNQETLIHNFILNLNKLN